MDLALDAEGPLGLVDERVDPVVLVAHAVAGRAEVPRAERPEVVHAVGTAAVGQRPGRNLPLAGAIQHHAEVLLDDLAPDADLRQVALESLEPAADHRTAAAMQLQLEAVRVACLAQQLARPLGVVVIAPQVRVPGVDAGRERSDRGDRLALEDRADHRGLVDGMVDGLTDAHVVERLHRHVEAKVAREELRDLDDVRLPPGIVRVPPVGGIAEQHEIQPAGVELRLRRGRVGDDAELERADVWPAFPVARVFLEEDEVVAAPGDEDERTGAHRPLAELPSHALDVLPGHDEECGETQREGTVHDRVGHGQAVSIEDSDATDLSGLLGGELPRPDDAVERSDERRARLRGKNALDAVLDVLGHHLAPVVEPDPAAQPERDRLAVGAHRPRLCRAGLELEGVGIQPQQRVEDVHLHRDGPHRVGQCRIEVRRIAAERPAEVPPMDRALRGRGPNQREGRDGHDAGGGEPIELKQPHASTSTL